MNAPHPTYTYSESEIESRPLGGSGSAGTLPQEPPNEIIERLHQAVKDVTGKPVEKPPARRIGFM